MVRATDSPSNVSYAFKDLHALEGIFVSLEAQARPTPEWLARARRRAAGRVRRLGDVAVPYLMRQLLLAREPRVGFARYLLARLRSPRIVDQATRLCADPAAPDGARVLALALLADLGVPPPPRVLLDDPDRVLASAVDQLLATLRAGADCTQAARLILSQVPEHELVDFGRATLCHAGDRARPLLGALVACAELGEEARSGLSALLGAEPAVMAPAARPLEDELERGIALFERGRFVAAARPLARFVAANPEDVEGRSTLGVCLTRRGQASRALPHLLFCAAVEPTEPLHHWNLAAAARQSGRLPRCYLALRAYLAASGRDEGERRVEAEGYVQQYEQMVRSEYPDLDPAALAEGEELFALGQRALNAGRLRDAVHEFERVLALVPAHYPTWGNLGTAYLELGVPDQATRCLERALELRPDYAAARRTLQELRPS